MQGFKRKLAKIKLTPESFFRICDYSYMKEVSTGDFKKKLGELQLNLDEKTVHRLVSILDEDFNGCITIDEYFYALDTY